jgi:hypothetical protein
VTHWCRWPTYGGEESSELADARCGVDGELAESSCLHRRNSEPGDGLPEIEVSDVNKAPRQHMEHEAAQELIDRKSQESLLVHVSGVSPAKRDLVILKETSRRLEIATRWV